MKYRRLPLPPPNIWNILLYETYRFEKRTRIQSTCTLKVWWLVPEFEYMKEKKRNRDSRHHPHPHRFCSSAHVILVLRTVVQRWVTYCTLSLFNFQFPVAGIRICITTRIIWSNSCEAEKAYLMCISIYLFLCKPILENSFLGLIKILLFLMLEKFLKV